MPADSGGREALLNAVENAEDNAEAGRAEVEALALTENDVVVGIAASGRTPYTVACVKAARNAGALTLGIANVPETPLLLAAEHAVFVGTGAEPIAGSTRMKAGTAQKIVLNLFSTSLMTGLGRVYKARMVDMRSRNAKLRERAVRMVVNLTECSEENARIALEQTEGHAKPAVLIALGAEKKAAHAELLRSDDNLRMALSRLGLARTSLCT